MSITEAILQIAAGESAGSFTSEQIDRLLDIMERQADCGCADTNTAVAERPCVRLEIDGKLYAGTYEVLTTFGGTESRAIAGAFTAGYSGELVVTAAVAALGGEGVAATFTLAAVGAGVTTETLPADGATETYVYPVVRGRVYSLTFASSDVAEDCAVVNISACLRPSAPTSGGFAPIASGLGRGAGIGKAPKPPAPNSDGIAYLDVAATLLDVGWQVKTEIETGLLELFPASVLGAAWFAYRNGLSTITTTEVDVFYDGEKLSFSGTVTSLITGAESVWMVVDIELLQEAWSEGSIFDLFQTVPWAISVNNS